MEKNPFYDQRELAQHFYNTYICLVPATVNLIFPSMCTYITNTWVLTMSVPSHWRGTQPMDKLTTRNLANLYNLIFRIEFERNRSTSLAGITYEDLEK